MKLLWVIFLVGHVVAQTEYPQLIDSEKLSAEIVEEKVDGDLKAQVIRLKNPLDWLKDLKDDIKEDIKKAFRGDSSEEETTSRPHHGPRRPTQKHQPFRINTRRPIDRSIEYTKSYDLKHGKGLINGLPRDDKLTGDFTRPTRGPRTQRPIDHEHKYKPIDFKPHEPFVPINHPPNFNPFLPDFTPHILPGPPPFGNNIPGHREHQEEHLTPGEFNCVCKPKVVHGQPQSFFTNLDCTCNNQKNHESIDDKLKDHEKENKENKWREAVRDWLRKVQESKKRKAEEDYKWRQEQEKKDLERHHRNRGTTPGFHDDEVVCNDPSHNHSLKKDKNIHKKSKKSDEDSSDSNESIEKEKKKEKKHKKDKKHGKKHHKRSTAFPSTFRPSPEEPSTVYPSTAKPPTVQPVEPSTLIPAAESSVSPTPEPTTVVERILK